MKFSRAIIIVIRKLTWSSIDRLLVINIEFDLVIKAKATIIISIVRLFSSTRVNKSYKNIID